MKSLIWVAVMIQAAAAQVTPPVPAAGEVTLPLEEYDRLTDLAGKPVKKAEAPPVGYLIQREDIKLAVSGSNLSGTVQLDGEVYASGLVRVPLLTGMTVLDARRAGGAPPMMWDNGWYTAVLTGPGEFSVTLDVGMPVVVQPGSASVTIAGQPAGTVRLTAAVPGEGTTVQLANGLALERTVSAGKTTLSAALTGWQAATLRWATREAAAAAVAVAPKEVRYMADVKSLVTVAEADVMMAALAEIDVVQGEPKQFVVGLPEGWEVTGATGATLESSEVEGGHLVLKVAGAQRSHAFLITLERAVNGTQAEVKPVSFAGAQRETGEMVVEGEGTMELTAKEAGGVKRMDAKEAGPALRSMAHHSMQAAFRYHRQPGEGPALALEWTRFPETRLLSAVGQGATVTTLVTSEGRSLTEVKLTLKNREQPFLKVALSAGDSIVSAEVAGQTVKPVQGADGSRVPLLRAGFRPTDAYNVSFVILHSGTPFERKGGGELVLPKMDVPVGLVEWEVFLPERYRVKDFGGDTVAAELLPRVAGESRTDVFDAPNVYAVASVVPGVFVGRQVNLQAGMLGGYIVDPQGAAVPGTRVTVTNEATGAEAKAVADGEGRWMVMGVAPGRLRIRADAAGFKAEQRVLDHVAGRGTNVSMQVQVGSISESIEVTATNASISNSTRQIQKQIALQQNQASANVSNLRNRVVGVLPIPVEVPKAGNSYRFARALVVDEETKLTFAYRAGK